MVIRCRLVEFLGWFVLAFTSVPLSKKHGASDRFSCVVHKRLRSRAIRSVASAHLAKVWGTARFPVLRRNASRQVIRVALPRLAGGRLRDLWFGLALFTLHLHQQSVLAFHQLRQSLHVRFLPLFYLI